MGWWTESCELGVAPPEHFPEHVFSRACSRMYSSTALFSAALFPSTWSTSRSGYVLMNDVLGIILFIKDRTQDRN
ncbi:hypothetical protein AAFF_G00121620 [Aldrovandia affinis]|uniref:Uncharacterized protein n=1 Tax=Aldrovandia affinis TaxID=143900 RepID=A0AAD7RS35_9TELE|nr:hypothetical protein AAFF_G00121620 [Aldrovandia affinis]